MAPFEFPASVRVDSTIDDGYMKHYVAVPPDVDADLPPGPLRVRGTLEGVPFRRTLHRTPSGRRLRFGRGWLKDAGLLDGAMLLETLEVDPDPDAVDLPAELEAALADDPAAQAAWAALAPGRKRTLAYGIARAKRPATRQRRATAVVEEVRQEVGLRW